MNAAEIAALHDIATAIDGAFVSPNVLDTNLEPSNLVDVGDRIARALARIADAFEAQAKIRTSETER